MLLHLKDVTIENEAKSNKTYQINHNWTGFVDQFNQSRMAKTLIRTTLRIRPNEVSMKQRWLRAHAGAKTRVTASKRHQQREDILYMALKRTIIVLNRFVIHNPDKSIAVLFLIREMVGVLLDSPLLFCFSLVEWQGNFIYDILQEVWVCVLVDSPYNFYIC